MVMATASSFKKNSFIYTCPTKSTWVVWVIALLAGTAGLKRQSRQVNLEVTWSPELRDEIALFAVGPLCAVSPALGVFPLVSSTRNRAFYSRLRARPAGFAPVTCTICLCLEKRLACPRHGLATSPEITFTAFFSPPTPPWGLIIDCRSVASTVVRMHASSAPRLPPRVCPVRTGVTPLDVGEGREQVEWKDVFTALPSPPRLLWDARAQCGWTV
ncbi:hypothetical protein AAHC03_019336 [Spirometra sp. Aus1]